MKMKKNRVLSVILLVALAGCAGGGVDSTATGGQDKFASAAPVQFLPYEVIRNNIIANFGLTATSDCVKALDADKELFGARTSGGARSLGFSITRQKKTVSLGDICCREVLKTKYSTYFDSADSTDFSKLGRAIYGRPLNSGNDDMIKQILAVKGYTANSEKQHAVCVSMFSSFENMVQ